MTHTDIILMGIYAVTATSTMVALTSGVPARDRLPLWVTVAAGLLWPISLPMLALS